MRDDLHGQVLFVAEAVRLTLDDANGVVQSLDATERDFVFGLTVGNDAVPMTFDHLRELLERLEPLPLECVFPVLKEFPGPGFARVVPQLPERFLKQVSRVEPPVGGEQRLECLAAIEVQILTVRQQGIAVPLDEAALLALHPPILGPARVEAIHNGIPDTVQDRVARTRLREEWGILPQEILVGVASRLDPVKGVAYLVDAFGRVASRYPHAKLVLIGAGSLDDALRTQVNALGLTGRVVFTGFRTDIAACLDAMDVFVLPSLAEYHSIGLLEAMRAAKAIVATDVGGNTESARHEQEALIVPPADAAAIVAALERFFDDPVLRNRLGQMARERYLAEFTVDQMVRRTAAWLERIAAQPVSCR